MPAVIPFIPLIAAGVSTAATLYSGHKASDTAKEVAASQQAAAQQATAAKTGQLDKALALQQQMYQQNSAAFQPWVTQGTSASNTMGNLMGLGGGGAPSAAAGQPMPTSLASLFGTNTPTPPTAPLATPPVQGLPREDPTAARRAQRTGQVLPTGETVDPASSVAQSQSSYTQMQAPDGSVESVPAALVDHYRRLGAITVN